MAAEIHYTGTVTISPDGMTVFETEIEVVAAMSGENYVRNKQLVATANITYPTLSDTVLDLGSVATPRWAWFKNRDEVNYIEIRNGQDGAPLIRLLAGEESFVPLVPTATVWAIADTAACELEYCIAAQ